MDYLGRPNLSSDEIFYDNTNSGLDADNIQSAIDLLNAPTGGGVISSTTSQDNEIVRFSGSTGQTIKTSGLKINSIDQLEMKQGLPGQPSVTFQGNLTTGMFQPVINTVAFSSDSKESFRINDDQSVTIGSSINNTKAILQVDSLKGVQFPRMTELERDAIGAVGINDKGLTVFNITNNALEVFDGTVWESKVNSQDHLLLDNIGVNSHTDIDSHIGDGTVHFTKSSISHNDITDTGVNSHLQIDTHIGDGTVHFTKTSISHNDLLDKGTNSHTQIDTHIGDGTVHFTEGSISHLNIQDKGVNSHTQIDTHIGDGTVHFTKTSISHNDLLDKGTNSHALIDTHIGDGTVHFTEGSISHLNITDNGEKTHLQIDNHINDTNLHFTKTSISHNDLLDKGVNSHALIDTHIGDGTVHFTEGSISHLNIQDKGTNSHALIDTHIGDGTVHFTEDSISHLNISDIGLLTHTQIDSKLQNQTASAILTSFSDDVNVGGSLSSGSINSNSVDSRDITTLLIGESICNKIEIGDVGVNTEIMGQLKVNQIEAVSGDVNIGTDGSSSQVSIGRAGQNVNILGTNLKTTAINAVLPTNQLQFGLAAHSLMQIGRDAVECWMRGEVKIIKPLIIGSLSSPSNSSILDIRSTDKGVLIPRMSTVQRDLITAVKGLLIYNNDSSTLEQYGGINWTSLNDKVLNDGLTTTDNLWSASKIQSELNLSGGDISTHVNDLSIHRELDDGLTTTTNLWSGSKINTELTNNANNLTTHVNDLSIHRELDDGLTTATNLWSGSKINTELTNNANNLTTHINDVSIHRELDDGLTTTTNLWSGSKINTELTNNANNLTTHINDVSIHRELDDGLTTTTNLWSGSKINTELNLKSNILDPNFSGSVGINGFNSNAVLEINSSTKSAVMPRMTSTQRLAVPIIQGGMLYDSTNKTMYYRDSDDWAPMYGFRKTGGSNSSLVCGKEAGLLVDGTVSLNVIIGFKAGQENTNWYNTMIGADAGRSLNGAGNTIYGSTAGFGVVGVSTGFNNCLFGAFSARNITTGSNNVFLGSNCGQTVTTGIDNVGVGSLIGCPFGTSNSITIGKDLDALTDKIIIGTATNNEMRANSDNICDLGSINKRYKDLHLGGVAYAPSFDYAGVLRVGFVDATSVNLGRVGVNTSVGDTLIVAGTTICQTYDYIGGNMAIGNLTAPGVDISKVGSITTIKGNAVVDGTLTVGTVLQDTAKSAFSLMTSTTTRLDVFPQITINSGASQLISFNDISVNSNLVTTATTATIATAGFYKISASMCVNYEENDVLQFTIDINSTSTKDFVEIADMKGRTSTANIETIVSLAATDIVELRAYATGGNNLVIDVKKISMSIQRILNST